MTETPYIIKTAEWLKACVAPDHWPETGLPEFAFSGRSNAGKSSLLNSLAQRNKLARVSKTPGCTQKINFFTINDECYFVDLPGYGYAKAPPQEKANWGKMIETYLKQSPNLIGLLQLLDVRRTPNADDLQMIEWAVAFEIPLLLVLTKVDKVSKNERQKNIAAIRKAVRPIVGEVDPLLHLFSAQTNEGREEILQQIALALTAIKQGRDGDSD
ncbi:YihA family ribosome biogenesis GTP-binding protein [Candidatus Sumerlaeota bacterium]|nr:YihA family ribosome biogenesis GTP-binding protein [Candidatus Sumerlaeota bacterium]